MAAAHRKKREKKNPSEPRRGWRLGKYRLVDAENIKINFATSNVEGSQISILSVKEKEKRKKKTIREISMC